MELKLVNVFSLINSTRTFNRTLWNWNAKVVSNNKFMGKLLIVPYGIETNTSDTIHIAWVLLIVPYGIETIQQIPCLPISFFF